MIFTPYPRGTEVNLRNELVKTFDGRFPEIAKRQMGCLRKARKDASGNLIRCACVDPSTFEADRDTFCPLCQGEGYIFDEVFMEIYKKPLGVGTGEALEDKLFGAGLANVHLVVFYTRFSDNITEDDRVVELVLDQAGNIAQPPLRKTIYRIGHAIDYRLDNGKLEYWAIFCHEIKRRFLNGVEQ